MKKGSRPAGLPVFRGFGLIVIVAFLGLLSGCQKLFDYIKDNPGEAKKYCKIKKMKWNKGGYKTETLVTYNAAGNPVSLLINGNNDAGLYWDYRFRYDKKNRLTDYIMNLHGSPGAYAWDRYSYPSPNVIVDTQFYYSGNVVDVIPPNASTAYGYNVDVLYLDAKGRIYKTNRLFPDGSVDYTTNYSYDGQGNYILEYTNYDDKVNPYRTNTVWSLVYRDYSLNNPLYVGHPYNYNNQIAAYNDWGLPLKMTGNDVQIFGNRYDTLEIEYQCSK